MKKVKGIHHISSTVGHAQRNVDFTYGLLGLRLVKNTLNYDDKTLFHFYYGNYNGSTGLVTTFPMNDAIEGIIGGGQVSRSIYAVPKGSLGFWQKRLETFGIQTSTEKVFGKKRLNFSDLDGLAYQFVERDVQNDHPFETEDITEKEAFIGIESAALLSAKPDETLKVLTEVLGYEIAEETDQRYLLKVHEDIGGSLELNKNKMPLGRMGKGTTHHIALHVEDDEIDVYRDLLIEKGYKPTEVKDRFYFKAIYFREPGGILIELATTGKGVTIDEDVDHLGESFIIPRHFMLDKNEILNTMMPIFTRKLKAFEDYGYRDKYEYDLLAEKKRLRKEISQLLKTSKERALNDDELKVYQDVRKAYLNLSKK